VTANILHTNRQEGALAAALADLGADLILVLEWTGRNADLDPFLTGGFELRAASPRAGTGGSCVLAKSDIEATFEVVASPVAGPCAMPLTTARIRWGSGWLSLIGVHAPPPIAACGASNARFLAALTSWFADGRLTASAGTARAGDPVVLMGDLNAHPWSRLVVDLRKAGLTDAFGLGVAPPSFTWRPVAWLPHLARIDYILLGAGLRADAAHVLDIPGSDHRLVLADVAWEP
jgi:endonuclease/exonuclease/phosphatase (EEP) superfamily protein YafD